MSTKESVTTSLILIGTCAQYPVLSSVLSKYALDENDLENSDEVEELYTDENDDVELDTEELYYLDMDEEDDGFIEALQDAEMNVDSDEYVIDEVCIDKQEN